MSKPRRIYLFLGPETGLKSEEIAGLKKPLTQRGDVEEWHFFSFDSSIRELWTQVRTPSLFGSARFVVFDGAHDIKSKDDLEALKHMAEHLPQDTVVVLVTTETRVSDKIKKLIPSEHVRIFWEMFDNQKKGWLVSYCRRHGVQIESEAAELMLELVENDTADLRSEANKLVAMVGRDSRITTEHVESFIYHSKEENSFSLFRHLAAGDLSGALSVLQALRLSGSGNPVAIVASLNWQFGRVAEMHALLAANYSRSDAFKRLNVRARAAQRDMGEAISRFGRRESDQIVMLLADYDRDFRSVPNVLHSGMLIDLMYKIVVHAGAPGLRQARFAAGQRYKPVSSR